jgi:hypothetical protein
MSDTSASAAANALAYAAALQRLAEIRDQLTSGVARVSKGDEMVVFQSVEDLKEALDIQQAEVLRLEGLLGLRVARRPVRQVVFMGGKGL